MLLVGLDGQESQGDDPSCKKTTPNLDHMKCQSNSELVFLSPQLALIAAQPLLGPHQHPQPHSPRPLPVHLDPLPR